MKKTFVLVMLFGIFVFLSCIAKADEIKGYMVPEFYYVAKSGDSDFRGQNGFWFRRIYFGYNSDLGEGWFVRVRVEMNNVAYKKSLIIPYLKNAYLKKKLGEGANLLIGLIEPPSFNRVEKFWGLRFVEKTPADFFKFASSRDMGISLNGKTRKGIVYTLMFGNYGSNKGEWNKGKAIYGRIGWEGRNNYFEFNAHYAGENNKNISYFSAFFGRKGSWGKMGLNYTYLLEKTKNGESKNNGILSGFGEVNIGSNLNFFVRYDYLFKKNFKDIVGYIPVKASLYKTRFIISGFDYRINKIIRVSPNIKYIYYGGKESPSGDFYINITLKVSFKTKL